MTARFDVLSYGTIGLDQIIRIPHWPHPDISTHATEESLHLGGKATNTAVQLAQWGLQVAISGQAVGQDDTAGRLLAILDQHPNIHRDHLRIVPDLASMYCVILVTPNGERSIIGVNADQNPQTPPTPEMIGDARLLTLDLYGGEERIKAARLAHEAGKPVVIGDLRDMEHPILAYTTTAIASAAEIRQAYPGMSMQQFAQAAQSKGAGQVIITDGPADVMAFETNQTVWWVTPPTVPVVDTTGAGDAFRAGVTFGVIKGWSLAACAAMGTAAGSLNIGRQGAASNPPLLEQVQTLAESLTRHHQ